MMAAGKKKPEEKKTDTLGSTRSLRDNAEKELAHFHKHSPELKGQTPEQLIHELQVNQIELETQAEELRKSKNALEESRDNYLDLYDFAPLGYLTLNDKALITGVNLTCATLLGVDRSDLVNHSFGRFIAPGDLENWDRYFANLRRHVKKQVSTLMLLLEDGSSFPARLEGVRTTGSDGTIAVRIAISDITDIWQVEVALRKSEEKYQSLFDNSSDAIVIHDITGRILDVNPVLCNRLGYSREEMLRMTPMDFDSPEYAELVPDRIHQVITKKHQIFETCNVRKDGTRIPTEINVRIIEYEGKQVCLSVGRDITERKVAEEALKNEKQRLASIIEGTRAGTWEWNVQTGETIFNKQWAEIIGYTLEEISPISIETWMKYTYPDDLQKSGELLERHFLKESESYEFESRMIHKKGHLVWVLDKGKVTSWTDDGKPLWMFGTHQDITERRRAEEAIRQ
ncbi:MAG: PAS domain-containing protein, partial [Methanoregula sp.]|nr:PAS domain-containing protein [Methanoregula sp.]